MVMHGESNIGKTLIVAKFQREHPSTFDSGRGVEKREIVATQMPATPDQHRFYTALLFELGAPHSATASLSVLERLARDLLHRIKPRMLIVDEVHHLLAGGYREQRASLNLLKYLANDLKISIVVVGTTDAPLALATDPQRQRGISNGVKRLLIVRAKTCAGSSVRSSECCRYASPPSIAAVRSSVHPVGQRWSQGRDLAAAKRGCSAGDPGLLGTHHAWHLEHVASAKL
jgi:hypothetical protein